MGTEPHRLVVIHEGRNRRVVGLVCEADGWFQQVKSRRGRQWDLNDAMWAFRDHVEGRTKTGSLNWGRTWLDEMMPAGNNDGD